jgi:hypothetical protein
MIFCWQTNDLKKVKILMFIFRVPRLQPVNRAILKTENFGKTETEPKTDRLSVIKMHRIKRPVPAKNKFFPYRDKKSQIFPLSGQKITNFSPIGTKKNTNFSSVG